MSLADLVEPLDPRLGLALGAVVGAEKGGGDASIGHWFGSAHDLLMNEHAGSADLRDG